MSRGQLYWCLNPIYRLGMFVLAGQLFIVVGYKTGAIIPKPEFHLFYRIHAVAVPTLLVAGLVYLLYRIRKDRKETP